MTDLTGQVFGALTVLERDYSLNTNQKAFWKCRCECGTICSKESQYLKNGHVRSCGCKTYEWVSEKRTKNEIGNKYGKLTVIDILVDPKDGKRKCYCQCECGNKLYVPGSYLRSNNTKSCGCVNFRNSYGAQAIQNYLEQNNIKYSREYSFHDLRSDKGYKLFFDFAVFDNDNKLKVLIEYDGPQHHIAVDHFGGEEELKTIQRRDSLKNDYCKKKSIPLIRIPYDCDDKAVVENLQEKINSL